jgi:hypothetical protein
MAIPTSYRTNSDTLLHAAADGNLALLECPDVATGQPRYVVCAVGFDGAGYCMTPFGHVAEADPFSQYRPPQGTS